MTVNTKKTKVMIATPTRRLEKQDFYFGTDEVECVDKYKYLGVIFNHKGTFTVCKQMLYEKARKASFKLRKLVNNEDLEPKLLIDLFDKLIKPIAMYGTEIWLSPQKIEKNLIKFTDSVPTEKITQIIAKVHSGYS
jgi:hypothetical protein